MALKRPRELALGVLTVLLTTAVYVAYQTLSSDSSPSTAAPASSNGQSTAVRGSINPATHKAAGAEAFDVHLQDLNAGRPKPDPGGRDLFRYRVKPPPPPPPAPRPAVGPPLPPTPPGPVPPPPITLKFIGVVDTPPSGKRLAVLSDGRGAPVYGQEGDTVLGQYRILRIGTESIEMSYLDGRGRQTIRLSGS
ncbi:MAG TPA: hypothetical protein VLV86_05510 [Vicinamibacterales bacterium]|nr:hypothetical protein [Vicinamibacterales bacterium]